MSIDKFEESLNAVLFWEGGLSDDKHDPGGKTRWGISTRFLEQMKPGRKKWGLNKRFLKKHDVTIDTLTRKQMQQIYWTYFWKPCHCDELPHFMSLVVFDCAVNQGVGRSSRLLQKALGVKVDGKIGPITMGKVAAINPQVLLRDFMARRACHYSSLTLVLRYGLGWFRRMFDIHRQACVLLPFTITPVPDIPKPPPDRFVVGTR